MNSSNRQQITFFDDRRDLIIPGTQAETLDFCVKNFIAIGKQAIAQRGKFTVALSGGSTPKAIFQLLASPAFRDQLDWKAVFLFWSDERCVSPDDPESNYHMAMHNGFSSLPIPPKHIFRMPADSEDLVNAAKSYESLILKHVPNGSFDLVTLGMGEDGHTASLFPKTHGLHTEEELVIGNYVPQKNVWRMTFTFACINAAHHIEIYVIGKNKSEILRTVLTSPHDPDTFPIQKVGTRAHKALWIIDTDASKELLDMTVQ